MDHPPSNCTLQHSSRGLEGNPDMQRVLPGTQPLQLQGLGTMTARPGEQPIHSLPTKAAS